MHCNMGAFGSESHVLLECPATQTAWTLLFIYSRHYFMLQFLRHAETHAVASLVLACIGVYARPPQE